METKSSIGKYVAALFPVGLVVFACAHAPIALADTPSYVPLYPNGTQVTEEIQYREPDGTLVTRMGMRPVGRHAREPWNNTEQAAGIYYLYPSFYFQNRTYGIEIHDHLTAGGTSIDFDLIVNKGTFDGTTFSLFRNAADPNVTGYGWALNYGFNNPTKNNKPLCSAGQPIQDCQMTVDSNWRTSPHSPLKIGDRIELAPAEFLSRLPNTQIAVIDGGGSRYYSFEQLYVAGEGLKPWYGVAPRLDSAPLPAATLLGGATTVSYNYSSEPFRAFEQMANNIGIGNTQRFVEGRRLFHTSFLTGEHSEFSDKNPVFTQHIGQLGPRFNQASCVSCHMGEGRSPAANIGSRLDFMAVLTGAPAKSGGALPDPTYGLNVLQDSRASGAPNYGVTISSYRTTSRTLSDGVVVALRKPVYKFNGPVPREFSVRQAPQLIGLGLLEAVPEKTILALADPNDANGDGVRGVPNFVTNPETGQMQLGRFGWKAGKQSLRQQAAEALIEDIGVTSPVFLSRACQKGAANCRTAPATPQVSETEMERFSQYLGLLGVPAQRSVLSGYPAGVFVPALHRVNPTQIANGSKLFARLNCSACHTPQLKTGNTHPLAELRNQIIHPYTDLLLHDMGPGLADTLPEGQAQPQMWRTQPLWGLGYLPYVQSGTVQGSAQSVRYLHDGRARTLLEAIEWHDGEAQRSRLAFEALTTQDRGDLLAFLNSL
jgi:CxxC motif-containing protein (DUF1111 family)